MPDAPRASNLVLARGTALLLLAVATPAAAIMDTANRGRLLHAGRFAMRGTNVGVVGNAFFNIGLSYDPSFEYPRGSGQELLNHAQLWVGAVHERGERRVSGGPMLEWRPTLDLADTVRLANAGEVGSVPHVDDDHDGRVDEERLNGRDDDGDARVDEDFLLPSQQMLAADFTDDQPEAVNYAYPTGEQHLPSGLAVHQESYTWSLPGHDGIAGIQFTITNKGVQTLRDLRLGLYADLDARHRLDATGHFDDVVSSIHYDQLIRARQDTLLQGTFWIKECIERVAGQGMLLRDADRDSGLPGIMLLGLAHSTDPLAGLLNDAFPGVRQARENAFAPLHDTTFRFSVFANDAPPGQGGPPVTDGDRYSALAGLYPGANTTLPRDYAVLLSCGPFPRLRPGQSLSFTVALVALPSPDSAAAVAFETRMLYRGERLDRKPNGRRLDYLSGETGINGHEVCLEPPPGVEFNYDPHCPGKIGLDPDLVPVTFVNPGTVATEVTYRHGTCIWTDLDCDLCTGDDGVDEVRHWEMDVRLPSSPAIRATPGDHQVLIEWDNAPEQAIAARRVGGPDFYFAGYKLYRLDDWRRDSELPPPNRWQRLAVFRVNPSEGGQPLSSITDVSVPPDGADEGGSHYPIGRYRVQDVRALNGFDYLYVVTTILRERSSPAATRPPREYESPFGASLDQRVVPHAAALPRSGRAWVVPNPYRGSTDWERSPVPGDAFTRHVDFMGLPSARCRIRIYTLAGDLVEELHHDGSGGNGQAAWNLISRNGQDVESGIFLFTVDSALGHQVGKFVLLR